MKNTLLLVFCVGILSNSGLAQEERMTKAQSSETLRLDMACDEASRAQLQGFLLELLDVEDGIRLGECRVETALGNPLVLVGVDTSGRGFYNQIAAIWEAGGKLDGQFIDGLPSRTLPVEVLQHGGEQYPVVTAALFFQTAGCSAVVPHYYKLTATGLVEQEDDTVRQEILAKIAKLEDPERYISKLRRSALDVAERDEEVEEATCRLAEIVNLHKRVQMPVDRIVRAVGDFERANESDDFLARRAVLLLKLAGTKDALVELGFISERSSNESAREAAKDALVSRSQL